MRNIDWVKVPQNLEYTSPSLLNRSINTSFCQSSINKYISNNMLNLDVQMRIEGLIMINETETISTKFKEQ